MTDIWGNLPRSLVDNTKVDEAISEAIDAHNDDSAAHLADNQAIEVHRQNEVIDHPAESVVNDKLYPAARAYVAIVDVTSETDFDTIESAVAEAVSKGGGNILVTSGTYYLSTIVDIPLSVNLIGSDYESTVIVGDLSDGKALQIVDDDVNNQKNMNIENITFQSDTDATIVAYQTFLADDAQVNFNFCRFTGGGYVVSIEYATVDINNCQIISGNVPTILVGGTVTFYRCKTYRYGSSATCKMFAASENSLGYTYLNIIDCECSYTGATNAYYYENNADTYITIIRSTLLSWFTNSVDLLFIGIRDSYITTKSDHDLPLNNDGNDCYIYDNFILPLGTGKVIANYNTDHFSGNYIGGSYSSISNTITMVGDLRVSPLQVLGGSATACNLDFNAVSQLTPNSSRTLTSAVPRPGERRTLIILTSGTTSYTLTFGTGFKTTGTLQTGATSARRFIIEFISDGTYLIESSRTTAIA